MNSLKAFIAYIIMAAPVQAGAICDELWFSRNVIFDQLGMCFNSPLGQAVFDNTNCISPGLKPDDDQNDKISNIINAEKSYQCNVDTSRTSLDIAGLAVRKTLADQPMPGDFESACIGWIGPIRPLRDTASDKGRVTEVLQFGDTAVFEHEPLNGFEFYQLYRTNVLVGVGWAVAPDWENHCVELAG